MSNREREYRRFNANRMGILEREAFINDLLFEEDENEDEDPFADDDDEDRDPNYLPLPECNQNDSDDEDEMIGDNVLPDASVGMGIEIEDEADDDADVLEYDEIENEIEDNIHMNATVSGGHYHARTGRVWDKQPMVAPSAQTQACNVFRSPISPGPLIHLKSLTLLNIFNRVFTADLKNDIIKWTNARAEHCYNLANAANRATRHWKPLCLSELDAFFGCLLYVGAMRDGHRRLKTLWSPQEGHVILRAAMSLTRFEMIQRFMRFDDSIGRRSQPHSNRTLPLLHPIGQLMDIINRNLASIYQPYENVTIDGQLKGFRGRCKFRQYMPAKPSKYGLKFWWITDSKSSFPLKCDIYTGAETSATDHGRAYDVVNSLMEKYINAGRNLTIDNYFTSVDLAQHLLAKRTTIVGTLRKNKRDIPKPFVVKEELDDDMTPLKNNGRKVYRTVNSSLFGFSDGMALCSYVPKPNKCVVLLSTQHSTNVDVVEIAYKRMQPCSCFCNHSQLQPI